MEFDKTKENINGIDELKLRKLQFRIYGLERNNYINKKMKDNQVVDQIIKIIDTEVQNDN